ncbi:MAG: DNA repair protein RecN, partial [Bacteroidales bacterium]|nr:DNA repair protein RecN [Bacteroidales bacterium]
KLSKRRKEGAVKLENLLTKEIRSLEMPVAVFKAEVEDAEDYTPSGADKVRFLFSANGDEKLVELQKVASGGELSRIMLCIKKVMAGYRGMPTLFFDEIDVGVSGSIADKVGQLLDAMGEKMQILAITHLPQVASKGKAHLLVTKELEKGGARSAFTFIKGKERVMEIARLLSGEKTTPQAVANAKVLLQAAAK